MKRLPQILFCGIYRYVCKTRRPIWVQYYCLKFESENEIKKMSNCYKICDITTRF